MKNKEKSSNQYPQSLSVKLSQLSLTMKIQGANSMRILMMQKKRWSINIENMAIKMQTNLLCLVFQKDQLYSLKFNTQVKYMLDFQSITNLLNEFKKWFKIKYLYQYAHK